MENTDCVRPLILALLLFDDVHPDYAKVTRGGPKE